MIGGEFGVVGMQVDVPFAGIGCIPPELVDVHFTDNGSRLIVVIDEKQAFALVEKLTEYIGKLTAERFKQKLAGQRGLTF